MYIFVIAFIILTISIFVIKMIMKRIQMKRLYVSFGLKNNCDSFVEINKEYYNHLKDLEFDEQTLYDVEINQIFDILNRTYTEVGREYLYGAFFVKHPRHQLLDFILRKLEDESTLKKTIYSLFDLNHYYNRSLSLFDYVDFLSPLQMILICLLGLVPFVLVPFYFVIGEVVISILFLWISIQVMIYTHFLRRTNNVMNQAFSYCHVVETLSQLVSLDLFDQEESLKIRKLIQRSKKYTRLYRVCMKIEKIDIYYLMELIYMLFPITFIQCYLLYQHVDELKEDYLHMYEDVGIVDMAVSIVSLRKEYQTCIPTLTDQSIISFQNIYHPILKNPVKNSFNMSSSCMITGSNASGKSTFMKTIGLNMVVAKTLHTCFADEFVYYPYTLCTSIHMKDELGEGDSYYVKEIKILKNIVNQVKESQCLVLIDEILKGTNEKERLLIAKGILRYLFESDSLVVVTTHDVKLVDYFDFIKQYCFNDNVKDNRLCCDYKIKEGICKVGNAIALLRVFGFEEEILYNIKD